MKAYSNANIIDGLSVKAAHALLVEDGIVQNVVPCAEVGSTVEVVDTRGANIAHGFVDLQVNGGGGVLFNSSQSREDVLRVIDIHKRRGTTKIFPTIFTSAYHSMSRLLDTVSRLKDEGVRSIGGIHFEGPVIDAGRAGIHDRANIRPLNRQLTSLFAKSARELPTLVTLAPEHVTDGQIQELTCAGVIVLAGHSSADYRRMSRAMAAGLRGGTHIFNAMSAFGGREPGVVGALLSDEGAYASIIADGHHVHWASMQIAWRAKKPGRLFLVTDCMPCVGSQVTEFKLGLRAIHVRNGRCETADGVLAGSVLDMATAARNMVCHVGAPILEAIRMATSYPAKVAGLQRYGELVPGRPADFIIFDDEFRLVEVFVAGRAVDLRP